jgi:5-methylcytosine-specific restriction endonuclease McrA
MVLLRILVRHLLSRQRSSETKVSTPEERAARAAYMREYNERPGNRDKKRAKDKRYRDASDKEKVRTYMAEYYLNNRQDLIDAAREHTQERRQRVKDSTKDSGIGIVSLRKRDGDLCHLCDGIMEFVTSTTYNPWKVSMDHVLPLAKGGTHTWDNVKLAHLRCNLSKGAKCHP